MSDKDNIESEETLADSPSEEKTTEEVDQENVVEEKSIPQPEKPKPEEEAAWEALSGKSQERFSETVRRAKLAEEELARLKTGQVQQDLHTVTPPQTDDYEIQQAIDKLRKKGVATVDDIYSVVGQMRQENIHDRLASQYTGSKDLPKYDRTEVEDYAKRKGFGNNYEAAFRDMYWDEFVDNARRERKHKSPVTQKPTTSVKDKPMTLEDLRKQLATTEGYEKWSKDPKKLDKLIAELTK